MTFLACETWNPIHEGALSTSSGFEDMEPIGNVADFICMCNVAP